MPKIKPSKHVNHLDRFWIQVDKKIGKPYKNLEKCWMWTGSKGAGDNVHQRIGVNGKYIYVHRYSWEVHFGKIPKGKQVLHKCDTPRCVNPKHLWIGTQLDNVRDMRKKGRAVDSPGDRNGARKHPDRLKRGKEHHWNTRPEIVPRGNNHWSKKSPEKLVNIAKGETCHLSRLREIDVLNIREEWRQSPKNCRLIPNLAKKYNVTYGTIGAIIHRQTWKHI